MQAFDFLAERKIEEALARGELDRLPGAGSPLDLYEDPLVPEEMRMAHRILKNADVPLPETWMRTSLIQARIEGRYFRKVATRLRRGA